MWCSQKVFVYKGLSEIYRKICTLLSFKYGLIISFRFSHMIQLANNALEHYKEFGNLFVPGFFKSMIYMRGL
ncbi:DUF7829 domain-containing protein [Flavobacterium akiainvivens]